MTAPLDIRTALDLLIEPGSTFEIRIPKAGKGGTVRGYFQDLDKAAQAASGWSGKAAGVYVTLNPVHPALYARAADRMESYAKSTTSDADIVRRRWLPVDLDPVRPAGISSSDAEHEAALALALEVRDALTVSGWQEPVYADSGNGAHLLYRIDLPNDDPTTRLIETCLKALASRFSTPTVKLDTGVANASRIWKLYGTMACKGDSVPDRPHRLARVLSAPQSPAVACSIEQLAALAATLPEPPPPPKPKRRAAGADDGPRETTAEDVDSALAALNPDMPYQDWLAVGMALHDWGGAGAFESWDRWSAGGSKYHEKDCSAKWKGFQPDGGVTVATLFKMAKDAGWKRARQRETFPLPDDAPSSYRSIPSWRTDLMTRGDSEQLLKNHYNAVAFCKTPYPALMGSNQSRQRIENRTTPPGGGGPGPWTEYDTGELVVAMAKPFTSFTFELLDGAIATVAHRHPFNPAQDRLRALADQWDGESRIGHWLVELGAKVNPSNADYMREISACWMKGVAARVLIPGCKRDDVLVLCGQQGWGKSTFAQALADAIQPDAFTDNLGDLGHKDAKASIRGIIIAELGELAALNKSDIESIKVFVATRSDHFREAYGRGDRDYPRTVSFIGTTNNPAFLIDPTGNRRWWPASIGGPIDIRRFSAVVPQLLGEAAARVLRGEAWHVTHLPALTQADRVREAHFDEDIWTSSVKKAVADLMSDSSTLPGANSSYVTIPDILNTIGVRIEQQTKVAKNRVGGVLRMIHFTERRKRSPTGDRFYVWYPPFQSPNSPDERVGGQLRDGQEASQTAAGPPSPISPTSITYNMNNSLETGDVGHDGGQGGGPDEIPAIYPYIGKINGTRGDLGDILENKGKNLSPNPGKVGGQEKFGRVGGQDSPVAAPVSQQRTAVATDPKARRITEQLAASPAGVTDDELKRAVCSDKGTSPAMVDLTLARLAKDGSIAKSNGRWVLMG